MIESRKEPVFRLFACCLPVRGVVRSTICDIQRGEIHFIPNTMYELLTKHRDATMPQLRALVDAEGQAILDEYFAFLEEKELGVWTTEPESFPDLNLHWDVPSIVTNAVIDVDERSSHDWPALLGQLHDLGCQALQVRVFCDMPLAALDEALEETLHGPLRSIDLLLKWTPGHDPESLRDFIRKHRRVQQVTVHSAPENRIHKEFVESANLIYAAQVISSHEHCGQVRPGYFTVGTGFFLEALHFNSCLNRKVSIDAAGEIRNCPSMAASFGNAKTTDVRAAVMDEKFRALWEVNKDQVEVCRDCEFRYVCPDCRAWVRVSDEKFAKPSKCGYDPYTATWRDSAPEMTFAAARPQRASASQA
ncbi:MAG TPA: grasp-with-spasm system SPASM domain peptide maturase [Thermoanaerobaculia bacterium]